MVLPKGPSSLTTKITLLPKKQYEQLTPEAVQPARDHIRLYWPKLIRFNEKDRQEIKTEYLVVGTLMSIGLAIITGLLAKA